MPMCFESTLGVTVEPMQWNQVYLECIGTSGSFEMVARPLSSSRFSSETASSLSARVMPGFLSQRSREMDPPIEMRSKIRALLEL